LVTSTLPYFSVLSRNILRASRLSKLEKGRGKQGEGGTREE
jgi:hypothetical protein